MKRSYKQMRKIARAYSESYLPSLPYTFSSKDKAQINPKHAFTTGFLMGTQYILDEVNFNETQIQDQSKKQSRRNKGI